MLITFFYLLIWQTPIVWFSWTRSWNTCHRNIYPPKWPLLPPKVFNNSAVYLYLSNDSFFLVDVTSHWSFENIELESIAKAFYDLQIFYANLTVKNKKKYKKSETHWMIRTLQNVKWYVNISADWSRSVRYNTTVSIPYYWKHLTVVVKIQMRLKANCK